MNRIAAVLAIVGLAGLVIMATGLPATAQPTILNDPGEFQFAYRVTDFETFPDGGAVPLAQAILTDQWQQRGFVIADNTPDDGAQAIAQLTGPVDPHSGVVGITDGPSNLGGFVRFDFVDPTSGNPMTVWEAGIWVQNGDAASTVTFFDADGNELGSQATTVTDDFIGMHADGGIAAIQIDDAQQYMVDDLTIAPRYPDDRYWTGFTTSNGLNGEAWELEVWNDRLYVGGYFSAAGGVAGTGFLAAWDGSSWAPAATPAPNGAVRGLVEFEGRLIVGGSFTNVGNSIAAWDGSDWSTMGAGLSGEVYDLLVWNGELYAAGSFPGRVARWDGSAWEILTGIDEGYIYSIVGYQDLLIGAGYQPSNGGLVAWDGDTWAAFQGGTDGQECDAVAVWNGDLYVGGNFSNVGPDPTPAAMLARWDGSAWSQVGEGLVPNGGYIWKLLPYDGQLLITGYFYKTTPENPDGALAGYAMWDGTALSPLGSGTYAQVYAIDSQAFQGALYTVGSFNAIGSQYNVGYMARWSAPVDFPAVTLPSNNATEGQSYTFNTTVTDAGDVQSVTLHYRPGGLPDWTQLDLPAVGSDQYGASLPAGDVTGRGIEYFVEASDGSFVTYAPPSAPDTPGFLPVAIGSLNLPNTPAALEYILFGFPFQPSGSAAGVIEDDLGSYDPSRWRLGRYDPVAERYREFPNVGGYPNSAGAFAPGNGYWLIQKEPRLVDAAGLSNDSAAGVSLTLQPGWTMLATPYLFPVNWSDVQLDAGIENTLWGLVPGSAPDYSYQAVPTLQPWHAYWVRNNSGSPQIVRIPGIDATAFARTAPAPGYDWSLRVRPAGQDGHGAVAATRPGAKTDLDSYDRHTPPPLPGAGDLSFLLLRNDEEERLAEDVRGSLAAGEGALWTLAVSGRAGADALALDVEGIADLPASLEAALIGPNGLRVDLRESASPRVPLDAAGNTRLTLAVGPAEFVQNASDQTAASAAGTHLAANYPNPFNPKTTLPFSLAAPAQVRLAIYDVTGRLQRTLVDAPLAAGEHWVNWDGRDEEGSELASGVYFTRFEAGDVSEVRKLLLLR